MPSRRARRAQTAAKPSSRIRTQGLTEGAILAALVAVLAIATRYLPLIGFATALLCPLPLAVLVIRHGLRVAAIAGVVATLVGTALAGPLVGLAILVSFAPIGLVLGIGGRNGWPATRIVLAGTAVALGSIALSYMGIMGGEQLSTAEMARTMERSMETSIELSERFYAWLGVPKAAIEAMTQQTRELSKEFLRQLPFVFPALLVLGAASAAYFNFEVGRRVLGRLGYPLAMLPPMSTWRVPYWMAWLLPLSLLVLLANTRLGRPEDVAYPLWHGDLPTHAALLSGSTLMTPLMVLLTTIETSLRIIVSAALTINGFLAGWVILGNIELTKIERTIAIVFLISVSMNVPLVSVLVFVVGLFDSVWKVRERWGLPRPTARGASP